ncbi:MAG: transcription initiation protein [Betaproteobacteria bacterium]|nr:transcription initiation protein [Betaproteobacteria bacterium]
MPKFITIGYGDENGYRRTAPNIREAAHAHDATMKWSGAVIGIAGPPMQVRNPDNSGVRTLPGPFMRSDLPIAGFALIEAADLREAIEAVSKTPRAVAHGVVEIWPLEEMP